MKHVNSYGDIVDISPDAIAMACMLVSNPQGQLRKDGDGWQKRVNDVIRAQRDELHDAQQIILKKDLEIKALTKQMEFKTIAVEVLTIKQVSELLYKSLDCAVASDVDQAVKKFVQFFPRPIRIVEKLS